MLEVYRPHRSRHRRGARALTPQKFSNPPASPKTRLACWTRTILQSNSSMLSLPDRLRARIQSEGPITFRDFMAAALYDKEAGYYCRQSERWGRGGDYWTSPERSELFAGTFANYFARLFHNLGSPESWVLLEAGAGSGKFAEGVLDTLRLRYPEVF